MDLNRVQRDSNPGQAIRIQGPFRAGLPDSGQDGRLLLSTIGPRVEIKQYSRATVRFGKIPDDRLAKPVGVFVVDYRNLRWSNLVAFASCRKYRRFDHVLQLAVLNPLNREIWTITKLMPPCH